VPEQPPELVHVPEDLALVPLDELRSLKTAAIEEWDRLDAGEVSPETVERGMKVTADIRRLTDEIRVKEQRAEAAAVREQEQLEARMKEQRAAIKPPAEGEPGEPGDGGTPPAKAGLADADLEKIVAAATQGSMAALAATDPRIKRKVEAASLAEAQRRAPDPNVPEHGLTVTASVDVPGRAGGESLSFDDIVDAYHKTARVMPTTNTGRVESGKVVATIRQDFDHTVDDRTPLPQMEELFRYLQRPEQAEALLAGGGWCAPSEVRYDFFNIACEDGLVDLPTFGVSRGGIRFPVSPSLADMQLAPFVSGFSSASNPWLWTETDDQATVTGTPNKPCFRVPCPTFDERRLECYGICLTAGNLTNDAYPEATQNTLRLLMAGHSHAMNARFLATMAGLSTAAVTLAGGTDNAFNSIVGGLSLAAADYRARYGMCADDILEAVIPYWVLDAIQSDLAWRTGDMEFLSVTKERIRGILADRNVRAQFVGDWQIRGAGQFGNATALVAWPTTVTTMLYAAGTFLKGNGLTLDLGVVRDSALNAENDYTAAWSEECHLVARVGHESRQYTITFNVGGLQGAPLGAVPGL
jgi:hypothetical protein